jgi:hypothetical protein
MASSSLRGHRAREMKPSKKGPGGAGLGWNLHDGVVRGAHGKGVSGEGAVGHHQDALAGRVGHDIVAFVIQLNGVDDVGDVRGACGGRQRWGTGGEGMSLDGSARREAL